MKVLLVNGSPHKNGCTYTALCEVSSALNENGISTDIFWIGNKPISGCIACRKCQEKNKCILDDIVNEFLEIAGDYDGFVFGTPVHWGGAGGAITSFYGQSLLCRFKRWRRQIPPETCRCGNFSKKGRNNGHMGPGK